MPRNVNGEYELPAGNPVVSGTIISTNWANDTMADLATALTNSLSRNGNGGMLAPFLNADGSESAPGIAWSNEPSTGFWRAGPQDMRASVSALATQRWNEQGSHLWRNSQWEEILTQTGGGGDTTINNLVVTGSFTSPGIDDNATSTAITIDASENVGVGNPSPQAKLEVSTGDNLDGDTIEVALGGTSGNTRRAIISKATAGDRDFSFYAAQGGSSSNTVFYRNATDEAMRIDSNGNVGIGTNSPDSLLHVDGAIQAKSSIETYQALTGTTVSIDCSAASVFSLSTSGATTFSFANVPSTSNTALGLTLEVTAGGTHTLTWPASVKWAGGTAPDAPASGETNIYGFYTRNAGTTWYGFLSGAAMA